MALGKMSAAIQVSVSVLALALSLVVVLRVLLAQSFNVDGQSLDRVFKLSARDTDSTDSRRRVLARHITCVVALL